MSALKLQVGACSERGPRASQEDAFRWDAGAGVFAVADGLGGHMGGAEAADIAVSKVVEVGSRPLARQVLEAVAEGLFDEANMAVLAEQDRTGLDGRTTLTLMLVHEDRAVIAWAGDSRAYRLRTGVLEQLTRDHRQGRHTLTKCLGSRHLAREYNASPELCTSDVEPGDVFLLCTDGIGDTLPFERIQAVLRGVTVIRSPPPAQRGAEDLVQEALLLGSKDNCTALVVLVGGGT